jgi:hypothetical protein
MKNIKSNPYANLNMDNKNLKLCLAWDTEGHIFKFDSRSHVHLTTANTTAIYASWEEFSNDPAWTEERIRAKHVELFGSDWPKKSNKLEASTKIWHMWVSKAEDRIKTSPSNPVNQVQVNPDGTTKASRKSTIGARVYTFLGRPAGATLKTPQAMACLKIVEESVDATTKTITEENLKAIVYTRSAELRTKQDAWRIFQYYRPQLIAGKFLKHN